MNKFDMIVETANAIRNQPKAITAGAWWRELFQPMTSLYQRVLDAVLREADIQASSEVLDAQIIRYREEGKAPAEVFNFLSSPQRATKPHFEAAPLRRSDTYGIPVTVYSDEEWELSHYSKQQVWVTETIHGCTVAGWRTQWVRDWELVKALKAEGKPTEFTYAYWSEKSTAKRIMNTQEHHLREEGLSKEDLVLFAQECAHPDFWDWAENWLVKHPATEPEVVDTQSIRYRQVGVAACCAYLTPAMGEDPLAPTTGHLSPSLAQLDAHLKLSGRSCSAYRIVTWDWQRFQTLKAKRKNAWFILVEEFFTRLENSTKPTMALVPRQALDAWGNIKRAKAEQAQRRAAYEQRKLARMAT